MGKTTKAKRTRSTPAPESEADCATLTLRVPQELVAKIDAEVEALNAKKQGHWSRNAYLVYLLETATKSTRGGK